jgi:hypothetical protein
MGAWLAAAWWAHSRARRLTARHAAPVEASLRAHREQLHLGARPGPG